MDDAGEYMHAIRTVFEVGVVTSVVVVGWVIWAGITSVGWLLDRIHPVATIRLGIPGDDSE